MRHLYKTEQAGCLLTIPLILRLFEYVRENNPSDEDLHFMAERISELANDGVRMSMNQYQSIIPMSKLVEKYQNQI